MRPMFYHANPVSQVGSNDGPTPNYATRGKNFYHNLQQDAITSTSRPRYSHAVVISGANIVNLPVPGVGSDSIK